MMMNLIFITSQKFLDRQEIDQICVVLEHVVFGQHIHGFSFLDICLLGIQMS